MVASKPSSEFTNVRQLHIGEWGGVGEVYSEMGNSPLLAWGSGKYRPLGNVLNSLKTTADIDVRLTALIQKYLASFSKISTK